MFDFLYWAYAAILYFVGSGLFDYFYLIVLSFCSLSAVVYLIKYILRGAF